MPRVTPSTAPAMPTHVSESDQSISRAAMGLQTVRRLQSCCRRGLVPLIPTVHLLVEKTEELVKASISPLSSKIRTLKSEANQDGTMTFLCGSSAVGRRWRSKGRPTIRVGKTAAWPHAGILQGLKSFASCSRRLGLFSKVGLDICRYCGSEECPTSSRILQCSAVQCSCGFIIRVVYVSLL
jgi:hypothetical protein